MLTAFQVKVSRPDSTLFNWIPLGTSLIGAKMTETQIDSNTCDSLIMMECR